MEEIMKLYNKKSIFQCLDEVEEQKHFDEITDMMELLVNRWGDEPFAYTFFYKDIAHAKYNNNGIGHYAEVGTLSEWSDMLERCDFKNGIDLYIDENFNGDCVKFRVYGQGYTREKLNGEIEHHMVIEDVLIEHMK